MTNILTVVSLAISAFWLGGCPFSLWIGRWLLGKDIRWYGDGNPGAANVFRAGDVKAGLVAVALDVGKGVPFVFIAHFYFQLPEISVVAIGLSAILGHAFSPFLHFRGGKAIAVTFGVLLALPQHYLLIVFIVFIFAAFLCIEPDAWTVIVATVGSLAYLIIAHESSWESLLMLGVLVLFVIKHYESLKTAPKFRLKPIRWYQSRSW